MGHEGLLQIPNPLSSKGFAFLLSICAHTGHSKSRHINTEQQCQASSSYILDQVLKNFKYVDEALAFLWICQMRLSRAGLDGA